MSQSGTMVKCGRWETQTINMLVIPKAFYVIDFWAARLLLNVSNKSIFWLQEYLMISALAISSDNMCPTSVKYPKLLLIQCQFIAIMYNCKRRNVLYSEASYKRTFACMAGHTLVESIIIFPLGG